VRSALSVERLFVACARHERQHSASDLCVSEATQVRSACNIERLFAARDCHNRQQCASDLSVSALIAELTRLRSRPCCFHAARKLTHARATFRLRKKRTAIAMALAC
jgi:hypothetical protein